MRTQYEEDFLQTPEILAAVIGSVRRLSLFDSDPFVYFSGCGTSWYLSRIAASIYAAAERRNAAAVTCSDVFLYPERVIKQSENALFILTSRSGESAEALNALREAKRRGLKTLSLGCKKDSSAMKEADYTVCIDAMERTILESYSFTAQAAAMLLLFNDYPGADALPLKSRACIERAAVCLARFPLDRIRRFVCMGYQDALAVCREGALKLGELTLLPAEAYSPLEYRHGPRSWAGDDTLAVIISSQRTMEYDRSVAEELVSYGAHVLWLGPPVDGFIRLDTGAETALEEAVCHSLVFQTLAIECGRFGNVDYDNPPHLLHAVRSL